MSVGRKPKPAALKKLEGNRGHKPIKPDPKINRKMPTPPKHLTPEAIEEWNQVVGDLFEAGLLAQVDRMALANYCLAVADLITIQTRINSEGLFTKTPGSRTRILHINPLWKTRNAAMDKVHKFLVEFGMTPSSRARVTAIVEEKDDPFEAWIKKEKLGESEEEERVEA